MAVENRLSTTLQNLSATPYAPAKVYDSHARTRISSEAVSIEAADDNGSTYRFFRVWSGWSLKHLYLANSIITGGTSFSIGLYAADGTALGAGAEYGTAIDLSSARTQPEDFRYSANAAGLNAGLVNNRIWQDVSPALTEDPQAWFDLVVTSTTVGSGAGVVALIAHYTAGD